MPIVKSHHWKKCTLSNSGQPFLEENEHDISIQSNVGIYIDDVKLSYYQSGRVYLTNQRIIYVNDKANQQNISLKLLEISDIEYYGGFLKSSPKVIIKMKNTDLKLENQIVVLSWVCPICYFTNDLRSTNNQLGRISDNPKLLPECVACGVKASLETINSALQSQNKTQEIDLLSYEGNKCPDCTFVNHSSMVNCEICGARLGSLDQKFEDQNKTFIDFQLANEAKISDMDLNTFKLSFRDGGCKLFYKNLEQAIKTATWENLEESNRVNKGAVAVQKDKFKGNESANHLLSLKKSENEEDSMVKPSLLRGIHGLATRSEKNNKEASLLLNDSIQDLDQLMSKAQQLISLSQKYKLVSLKSHQVSNTVDDNLSHILKSKGKIQRLNGILHEQNKVTNFKKINSLSKLKVGKPSIGTKSKFPQLYIDELSRNLSDFLSSCNILEKNNGLITLQELYLLYNKVRKTNIISPEELYDATSRFSDLKLKFQVTQVPLYSQENSVNLRKHILVISKSSDTSSIDKKICQFIIENPGQTILQLQTSDFNMSYMILKAILDKLVHNGDLVIDSTVEGMLYWPNIILTST